MMIPTPFSAEETAERALQSHFPLSAQEPLEGKLPGAGQQDEGHGGPAPPSPDPFLSHAEQNGSESPAPESDPEIQTETTEISAQAQPGVVYMQAGMSSAQLAYNSSLQGLIAARLSAAVTRVIAGRERPDPEEENKAWEVVEAATPLDRIRAFYPNFAHVFHMIVKIIYRELKINGYSYDFVRDLKSRQRNPEHMSLDAILIEAGASPREMKEKFASNPQEREDLEAYILLAAVLLIKTFKPDPWTEKYKTIAEFLEAYPELADETDKEVLVSLQLFANVMVNVLRYINGKGNQQRLLTLVACLSEGPQHSRYITGGAQSKKTARRVMIYRRESNTHKISRPRRSRDRRGGDGAEDGNPFKRSRQVVAIGAPPPSTLERAAAAAVKREPSGSSVPVPRPSLSSLPPPTRPASELPVSSAAISAALAAMRELGERNETTQSAIQQAEPATASTPVASPVSASAAPVAPTAAAAAAAAPGVPKERDLTPLELLYASAQKMQAAEPPIPTKKRPHHSYATQRLASPVIKHDHSPTERPAPESSPASKQVESHVHPAVTAVPHPQFMYPHPMGATPYPMHHSSPMVPMQREGQPASGPMPYPIMTAYGADPRMYEEQRRQMAAAYPMPFMQFHPQSADGAASTPSHPVMYGPPLMMPYPMSAPAMPSADGASAKAEGGHAPVHPYYAYPPMMPTYIMPPPGSVPMTSQHAPPAYSQAPEATARPEQPEGSTLMSMSTAESMDTVNALLSLSASGSSAALASK